MEVRNNAIIRLLEETTDIVENRHTGIATMREEMQKANLPQPEFEILRGTFKVTFRKEKIEESGQKSGHKIELNETQKKLLEVIKSNPNITQKDLTIELNLGRTAITKNIKILKDNNIIERIGSDRKGYWKIL